MATSFPTTIDNFTNPTATSLLTSPSHSGQHTDINDAVEALEAKVGVNNSAVTTSLDYRVGSIEGKYVPLTWRSGDYERTPWGNTSTTIAFMTRDRMFATAIYVPKGAGIDRVAMEVTTVGGTGSVIRMGLYANGTNGPSSLLFDGGTVDSATSTGFKELTVSWTNLTDGIYWLVGVAQGGTAPNVRSIVSGGPLGGFGPYNQGLNAAPDQWQVYQNASVTGALPSTFTTTGSIVGLLMIVRAG